MSHIFLYGPPGTGKSTIGRILARNLKLPFIDLDLIIKTSAGMSIPEIMYEQGEPAFRDIETSALQGLINEKESVIALGGGALLRDENRTFAESHGRVVLLMAELTTLLERLQNDSGKRPLLVGELSEKLTSLLAKRSEHYNSFSLLIHVDEKTADQNAYATQVILGRHHLSAMGEYDVIVGQVANLPYANSIIVTDENIAKFQLEKIESVLRASGCEPKSIIIPAGEEHKNLETVSRLWKSFLDHGLDRKAQSSRWVAV